MKRNHEDMLVIANAIILIAILSYTGFSKISDIDTFEMQLRQSPIIPELATKVISICLPVFELVICLLLITDRYRLFGIYLALQLFVFFAAYLIVLTSFFDESKIPCACGGVLGKMNYPFHIVLNLGVALFCFATFFIRSRKVIVK